MRRPSLAVGILGSIAVLLVGGFLLLSWVAFARHEFGSGDPRYLMFVRGTWTEQIGLISPQPGSVRFQAEGPDGPGAGFLRTRYDTGAAPETVIDAFEAGCLRLGLEVAPARAEAEGAHVIVCTQGHLSIALSIAAQEVVTREDIR